MRTLRSWCDCSFHFVALVLRGERALLWVGRTLYVQFTHGENMQ
jgi:hypothetical protein